MSAEIEVTSQAIKQLLSETGVGAPHVRVSGFGQWYIDRRLMDLINLFPWTEVKSTLYVTLISFVVTGQPDDRLAEFDAAQRLGAHWTDALRWFSNTATGRTEGA